ncbi:hypothetical protein V5F77_06780 [Xanthobacter sp. DSM 24535]|uniref:hypothetical protein n=1 Tax=Roseixanthobacter psychrophilus TaxID=3119917 RepID=UPI00372A3EBD
MPRQNWTIVEAKSPLVSSRQISASIWAEQDQAIVAIRCLDDRLDFLFSPSGLAAPHATAKVTYRIGEGAPITGTWDVAPNRQDLLARDPVKLFEALPDQGVLSFRAEGRANIVYAASFAYRGMNEVRTRFAAICDWKAKPQPVAPPPPPSAQTAPAPPAQQEAPAQASSGQPMLPQQNPEPEPPLRRLPDDLRR